MTAFNISQIALSSQSDKFTQFYIKHCDKMMSAAYAVLKNHHDAEEAVQNALFAIAKNISSIPDPNTKHCANYAVKAAKNHAINIAKKRKLEVPLIEISADDVNVSDEFASAEQYRQIVEAICEMKQEYRDVLTARFLHDLSAREISELYGIPLQTVKTRLARGMKILRKTIERGKDDV